MEQKIQKLMQVSALLYQQLGTLPDEDSRDEYIEKIHSSLDERGSLMKTLKAEGFQFNQTDKLHSMLQELDKGINERLANFFTIVKTDLKTIQNAKKNEQKYINPYSNVQIMDGRYYDKKK